MGQFDAEDLELIEGFREESEDHLEVIEDQLLKLEREEFDKESINLIFRSIHTIKGGSGFLGFNAVKELSHRMESLLDCLRNSKVDFNEDVTDVLLRGTDLLKAMFEDLENQDCVDTTETMLILDSILAGETPSSCNRESKGQNACEQALLTVDDLVLDDVLKLKERGFNFIRVTILKSDHEEKVKTQGFDLFSDYFNSFGKLIAHDGLDGEKQRSEIVFGSVLEGEFASAALCVAEKDFKHLSESDLKQLFAQQDEGSVQGKVKTAKTAVLKDKKKAKTQTTRTNKTLKVSTQLLGNLMSLAGELILCRNQLVQEGNISDMPVLHTLNQRLSELQETVMKTRLQPVGAVFNKVPRMVRDLSRSLDKHVEVDLSGVDVELDRTIIDAISDPLTHLVRNSIDHGFEERAERVRLGKSETCNLSLRAFHESGMVNLEIKDDGRGIDADKLKMKALEKGLISGSEAASMGYREALSLIFRPGFSMAKKVTEISGRGVGMDVVKTSFEKLGGTVDLYSELGVGTTVLVKLPTTLAIVSAVIAQVEDYSFAISQSNIEEIVRLKEYELPQKLEKHGSFEVYRLRGQLLPVVRLADIFKIERTFVDKKGCVRSDRRQNLSDRRGESVPSKEIRELRRGAERRKRGRTFYIVVVRVGSNRFGVLINKIQNTEEIVIKPLSSFIKNIDCFHGSTIRGDGKVIMVLDCNGLAKTANLTFAKLDDLVKNSDSADDRHNAEKQSFLIFNNHFEECFALPLSFITRIEKVYEKDIVQLGDRELIQLDGKNVPLFRLESKLKVKATSKNKDGSIFLILPNMMKSTYALVCSRVLDVVSTEVKLETEVMPAEGVIGTSIINGRTTVILDIHGLLEEKQSEDKFNRMNYSILLVEDTPFFMNMIKLYLLQAGFKVDEAVNGLKAWERLEQKEYDLVLSDIEMPEMDGYELVHKIKTDPRFQHLPVMAITALDNPNAKAKGQKAGFDAYQVKLDKAKLIQSIYKLIHISKGIG
ncbi:MAG: hybrid sensor histidine kinase/response regulator [Acidobacteria bacterium]|nr:MAG: hybrid sensor histidine kinase/response regulator [Acidobacteriota bacterium]